MCQTVFMKILVDTDPGVDDAFALLFALANPNLEVIGVTTVGGNAFLDDVTRNASGLLALAKRYYDFTISALHMGLQSHRPGRYLTLRLAARWSGVCFSNLHR